MYKEENKHLYVNSPLTVTVLLYFLPGTILILYLYMYTYMYTHADIYILFKNEINIYCTYCWLF